MPLEFNPIIGVEGYKIISSDKPYNVELKVEYTGLINCPFCKATSLRKKDTFLRRIKHYSIGNQRSELLIKAQNVRLET